MTDDCRYCGASFGDREAYVRHLATAHEPSELSRVDARLVERREPNGLVSGSSGLSNGRERVRSFLGGRATAGSMRLPVGRGELMGLSALAVAAAVVVGTVLAL